MYSFAKARNTLIQALEQVSGESSIQLDIPKNRDHGDLTTNIAMRLAAKAKKAPMEMANELVLGIQKTTAYQELVQEITAIAPGFINIRLKPEVYIAEFLAIDATYGAQNPTNTSIVIEYSSPNTNKPIHVGHLRNNALGMCLAQTMKFLGNTVTTMQIINDRGIQITKSMLAYQLWGNDETPESVGMKGDAFVAKYYVLFGQKVKEDPELQNKAQEMLVAWEAGDPEIHALWEKMNQWVYPAWEDTYARFGSVFDTNYYESQVYDKGKELVLEAAKNGIVQHRADGAYVIDLSDEGFGGRESGEKVLLRSDGTTVYMTQDLYLAVTRYQEYGFDQMYYIVGNEQEYHFKVLFSILKKMGYSWAGKLEHFAYGHVLLPEGKMKSREGTVVDADDLLDQMYALALQEVENRNSVQLNTKLEHSEKRAKIISLASIKYWFLKNTPKNEILFDTKKALDFEGNTGPYLLYTYARLGSVLEKYFSEESPDTISDISDESFDFSMYEILEQDLIRKIITWPEVVMSFGKDLQTQILCEYIFDLAQSANTYYHAISILKTENTALRKQRLLLIQKVRIILAIGLGLMNIELLEKM